MAKIRKIHRSLKEGRNYYVIDANFLSNKYLDPKIAPSIKDKKQIEKCQDWWKEIDKQLKNDDARIYIPDLCIAEAFKTLAKKYYSGTGFINAASYNYRRKKLIKDITIPAGDLQNFNRKIKYHDISTSRDLIIAVDRFFEIFIKNRHNVSVIDLIILATAKYLMDFFDLPKNHVHIITCDKPLRTGSKKVQELPHVYDPTEQEDEISKVFID